MKAFTRLFANLFTSAISAEERERREAYRAWAIEREKASRYGHHHVQEIDAIFSRAGL